MGFTSTSGRADALRSPTAKRGEGPLVALVGNPNTGKSTVFNALTGLNQHTGNWPGKTITYAKGKFEHSGEEFMLIDLPGTYSLLSSSAEEEVARDFVCFEKPDVTVVVTDATCLERNLNLVLQVFEITADVVVCVNLMDEAQKKGIGVDLLKLSEILGVPVVGTSARNGKGLEGLKSAIYEVSSGKKRSTPISLKYGENVENAIRGIVQKALFPKGADRNMRWVALRLLEGDPSILDSIRRQWFSDDEDQWWAILHAVELVTNSSDHVSMDRESLQDEIISTIVTRAEKISNSVVTYERQDYLDRDRRIDSVLTSKLYGIPIMLGILGLVFWITISAANYPSELLARGFNYFESHLTDVFIQKRCPLWLHGILILGIYRTCAWVISVMLPPMAIFFPLFTLLEDLGYLPRVAFNLDNFFKRALAHGKQALTMCMGFGCNAAGVVACRIIDSPRERMIAIVTNNFVPCNGRFPMLIALSTIFIAKSSGKWSNIMAALILLTSIVLAVIITLSVSKLLSQTLLRGLPSSFVLELPPYRSPHVGRVLLRSLLDRTLFVLIRAVAVALPAGAVIWWLANTILWGDSVLTHTAMALDPFARFMGLDGYILLAFILGLPANEIVIPIIIMSYMSTGALTEMGNLMELKTLLTAHGWTNVTAVCTMLFSLNHFPCGTTLLTIYRETQSAKWTMLSFVIPTLIGVMLCSIVAQGVRVFGL